MSRLTRKDFVQPHDVSDVQRAFPAMVVGTYLPPYLWFEEDDVPEAWRDFVNALFAGQATDIALIPAEGIEAAKAWDHATMVLGSFEPKHEHKVDGVAWLLWHWFDSGNYTSRGSSKQRELTHA